MRKTAFILPIAVSMTLLVTLVFPTVSALGPDYNCICDHWDLNYENTIYDEYTGTGMTGWYGENGYYNYVQWWFQRGLGGYYVPTGDPLNCHREWYAGYGYQQDFTWNSPVPWTYPVQPFPGGYPYYHCQQWIGKYAVSYGEYAAGSASSWFQYPPFPLARWYDQGRLCAIYRS